MSQPELLTRVVRVLEDRGIEYMVTGSVASSLHGQPRLTHDIDLVVAMRESDVVSLMEAFPPPDFYLSEEAIRDALMRASMFNLLSRKEGDKIDFWVLTDSAFDRSRFARRVVEEIAGVDMSVSTPEDTILAKLVWAKRSGGSDKQFGDALGVYEVQHGSLDEGYLEAWAQRTDVADLLERLRSEAET